MSLKVGKTAKDFLANMEACKFVKNFSGKIIVQREKS